MFSRRSALSSLLASSVAGVSLVPFRQAKAGTTAYQYDALGRVIGVTYPDGAYVQYEYDAADNRTKKSVSGSSAGSPNYWPSSVDGSGWTLDGASVASDTINGNPASRLTTLSGGLGLARATTPSMGFGAKATLQVDLLAVTRSVTNIALIGSVESWGFDEYSTGSKSGPGALNLLFGGLWQVSGLSTTQPTKVTINWENVATQSVHGLIWASEQHAAGDALKIANTQLTVTPAPTNLWPGPTDPTQWVKHGAIVTQDSPIRNIPAFRITGQSGDIGAISITSAVVAAGKIATLTLYVKATPTNSVTNIAILGGVDGWGADNTVSSAVITAGPGGKNHLGGGLWQLHSLSTTEPTKIEITRKSPVSQTLIPLIWASESHIANDALIIAGLKLVVAP